MSISNYASILLTSRLAWWGLEAHVLPIFGDQRRGVTYAVLPVNLLSTLLCFKPCDALPLPLSKSYRTATEAIGWRRFLPIPFIVQLTSNMAYQALPAVCSLPAYETFSPLEGFPPALGYCSTATLLDNQEQCIGESHLCDLLSELVASDDEFARGVWYVRSGQSKNKHLHAL